MMRLIEQSKWLNIEGEILFRGGNGVNVDLMTLPEKEMQKIRGNNIAMIFQEPMSSLNPIFTNGDQVVEAIRTHQEISRAAAQARALEMFTLLGIPNPEKCLTNYPRQISGGMRQRVVIAMALVCHPEILICDEPTVGLAPIIAREVYDTIERLKADGLTILLVDQNVREAIRIADQIYVLEVGQIKVSGTRSEFETNLHDMIKDWLQI